MEKKLQNMSYILQFIDTARFISSLLSNLANILSEGMHRTKCKCGHNDKKNVKHVEFNINIAIFFLNT